MTSQTYVTQEVLDDARKARHALMTGQGIYQFRDQNGEQVSYTRADLNKLNAYIRWLEVELGAPPPVPVMKVWM